MKTVLLHDQPLSGNGKHSAKRFGRGRIAGLTLIALLTLGLGYLHVSGGSNPEVASDDYLLIWPHLHGAFVFRNKPHQCFGVRKLIVPKSDG